MVNNAGSGVRAFRGGEAHIRPFVETTPEEWEPVMRVNLYGVLHVTHTYLPAMIERSGAGSSRSSPTPAARASATRRSTARPRPRRWASPVAWLPRSGRAGVTVNCIALGTIRHGDDDHRLRRGSRAARRRIVRPYPVGRLGRVDDPAPLAVLLCSDAAEWITGQVYPVDGGYTSAL